MGEGRCLQRPRGVLDRTAWQTRPAAAVPGGARLRLQSDLFIGGRVNIPGNQADTGHGYSGAGGTQEGQLPEGEYVGCVIGLLLDLVQQRLPRRTVTGVGL